MSRCAGILFFVFLVVQFSPPAGAVEDSPTGAFGTKRERVEQEKTYISPFLERDRLNIIAVGDWMAHGIWWGLYDRFRKDKSVSYTRNTNYASGFVRKEAFDWNARLERITSRKRVDVAILAFGSNDGRDMKLGRETVAFNSSKWRDVYSKRVDRFIVGLKQHGAAIYWLGLPIVKRAEKAEQYRILNGVFKQIARKNEIKFIESWHEFSNQKGEFIFAGLDINGKPRLLRTQNGLHFTMSGYRKLGRLVDRILTADLSAMDAASKSSLEGSNQEDIAITSPDSRVLGRLSPEAERLLETGGSNVSFINSDPSITGSTGRGGKKIDTIAEFPGEISSQVSPTWLRTTAILEKKITKPSIKNTQNSLASPEVDTLLRGGYLAPKPGRDDDYSWPRQF